MIYVNGMLYAVEPNHGEIDQVDPATGTITRLADISATQGHIVPTSVAYNAGNFFVGNLGTFPITPGSEKILQITPSGTVTVAATGLTTVVGVAFDRFGQMYALETATNPGLPGPTNVGTGMIVKVTSTGSLQTIASGFTFPTGMTFGPDGNLYVSQSGFGLPAGSGQVLKVTVPQGIPLSATVAGTARQGGRNRAVAIAN
jgi:sugar lactone lactonase YvrE